MPLQSKRKPKSRATHRFLELNPNPVLILDRHGRVTFVNATARARFPGLTEMKTRHPVLSGLDRLADLAEDDGELVIFVREIAYSGIVYEQQVLGIPGEEHLFLYMTDITERQRSAEKLRASADSLARTNESLRKVNATLRKQNAELDEFVRLTSHDLQEPLRKLIVFSGCLCQDLGSDLPPRARQDLDFISEAARRMQKLVNALLTLCRAGRTSMRHERVALAECVERALQSHSATIEERQACITRDELPEVMGDPHLLTLLFENLVANALKFVAKTCRPEVHVTAERCEKHWIIGVRDNGIGIRPEYQRQIFAPFRRLHDRSEYEGPGVGLSICRKAVELHGGTIWVESEPGRGSHFKFALHDNPSGPMDQDEPGKPCPSAGASA